MAMTSERVARRTSLAESKRPTATKLLLGLLFIAWVGEWPVELDSTMYLGHWRSPFGLLGPMFNPVPGIRLFPWQLLLLATVPMCLALPRRAGERAPELGGAILASVVCIVIAVMWGWARGGSPYFAYYQVWRFLFGLLLAFLLMSAIRTPADLAALAKIVVVSALIRATLVIYYYWTHLHGKVDPLPEYVTNHDDSLLFVTAVLISGCWAFVKGERPVWKKTVLLSLYLFYAMVLNDRRIAWVELLLALVAIYVLIGPGPLRTRINKLMIGAAPLLLVYVAAGWGREGAFFAPVQALSSTGSDADPSSLTRQEELRNLLYTLTYAGNPLLGTGWGLPYIKVESIWSNYSADWVLVLYTPHNSLLGLAVFSGMLGIIGTWGVVPLGAWLAALGYRNSADQVPRAAALVAVGILVAFSVHCYGDIGLQSFPGCLIMGVGLAAAGKVRAWSRAQTTAQTTGTEPAAATAGRARRMVRRSPR